MRELFFFQVRFFVSAPLFFRDSEDRVRRVKSRNGNVVVSRYEYKKISWWQKLYYLYLRRARNQAEREKMLLLRQRKRGMISALSLHEPLHRVAS